MTEVPQGFLISTSNLRDDYPPMELFFLRQNKKETPFISMESDLRLTRGRLLNSNHIGRGQKTWRSSAPW